MTFQYLVKHPDKTEYGNEPPSLPKAQDTKNKIKLFTCLTEQWPHQLSLVSNIILTIKPRKRSYTETLRKTNE